jgi:hypothetical protein
VLDLSRVAEQSSPAGLPFAAIQSATFRMMPAGF